LFNLIVNSDVAELNRMSASPVNARDVTSTEMRNGPDPLFVQSCNPYPKQSCGNRAPQQAALVKAVIERVNLARHADTPSGAVDASVCSTWPPE